MTVPDFQSLMLPLLRLSADGREHRLPDARESLATELSLTESDRTEMLPSGRQTKFVNRVAWAKVYLEQAGLVTSTRRAHFRITDRGRDVLKAPPMRIDIRFLSQYPEFQEFRAPKGDRDEPREDQEPETPEEALEVAHRKM